MSRPLLLAYRALGLGDLLTGIPALRALRDAFAEHELVLAAPAALEPLARLSGAIDRVADAVPLAPLPPELHGADVAVNLHGRGPQSHEVLLATGPARLIAFGCVVHAGPQWRAHQHEVRRWCRLLEESGIPADPARLDLPRPTPDATNTSEVFVVHPGAASAARRWPAERWAAVARAERDAGRRVVITGSAAERGLAEAVARGAGIPAEDVLAGRTDLMELAGVIAHAAGVVCGDTGVAHLATAFGTPSVLLFGPTPPQEWGPPPDRPQHVVLHRGDGRGDPHANQPDPALLRISVQDVVKVTAARIPPGSHGYDNAMGITDKISGRVKQAAGDLTNDADTRREGKLEERKGEAKDERARAEERAEAKEREVANLESRT